MRPINRDRRKYIGYIGYIYIYIRGQILPLHYIRYFLYTLTADILLAGSELPLVKHKVYIIHTVGIEWWGENTASIDDIEECTKQLEKIRVGQLSKTRFFLYLNLNRINIIFLSHM